MKENKYDNKEFFEKYSNMERSKKGLEGAGEWQTLKKMIPSFTQKRVLDLGCGYGWHCIYAAENGASEVVGIDISEKMLDVAKQKTNYTNVTYLCVPIEEIEFKDHSFDVVISSLAFHYLKSFDDVIKKISNLLAEGGEFVFSVEHPIFTAHGKQDWYYDNNNNKLHFPVDNYFYEGKRTAIFLGEEVTKYHRTLTTYIKTLLDNGFEISSIAEPQPSQNLIDTIEGMSDELRRPMMLIISARKL